MAVDVLYSGQEPEAQLPGDPEENLWNFKQGQHVAYEPEYLDIHVGMRLVLTRNIDKARGFVNGMGCVVRTMRRHGLEVLTDQQQALVVYPYTDVHHWPDGSYSKVTFFPIRLGYATTLHKVQGATLDHATIWLDVANIEAAGYVALSRVRTDADWQFVGQLTTHHFTPASDV